MEFTGNMQACAKSTKRTYFLKFAAVNYCTVTVVDGITQDHNVFATFYLMATSVMLTEKRNLPSNFHSEQVFLLYLMQVLCAFGPCLKSPCHGTGPS